MCGIVGAVAARNVENILVNALQHLEYRGYDSAGLAVITEKGAIDRLRVEGKVDLLKKALAQSNVHGHVGIAHTRWATHGKPCEANAHPHVSHDEIAIVHNGIIENHEALRSSLQAKGYQFLSETDSEIIAHLVHFYFMQSHDILQAIRAFAHDIKGAYAVGILLLTEPHKLYAVRSGSPLVVGVGVDEHFIASDPLALMQLTQKICYLEEGDVVELSRESFTVFSVEGKPVKRQIRQADIEHHATELGAYRHYMLKEIYEQPEAIAKTLAGRLSGGRILVESFSAQADTLLAKVKNIHIVACGSSYHAGFVAKYWMEDYLRVPCSVEVASEFRYRSKTVPENTLLILISQSGETADLLAALRDTRTQGYLASLAIVNVPMSSLAREADFVFLSKAGQEIGVASTKAFTAQLAVLAMLTIKLAQYSLSETECKTLTEALAELPKAITQVLKLDKDIQALAPVFQNKEHALFLGRGVQYPIAIEGALKLKEISYIHAEAYPAGELKHGPLALVDNDMLVVACVPDNALFEKLKSNLQEVRARGGQLIVFTDNPDSFKAQAGVTVLRVNSLPAILEPIVYAVALQLLAYYVAIVKGTDVDKPRNLAKSVTVE